MSVIKNSNYGYFISHELLINEIYNKVDDDNTPYKLNPDLFNIWVPYKSPKISKNKHNLKSEDPFKTEVEHVESLYNKFFLENKEFFNGSNLEVRNTNALNSATEIYNKSGDNLITDLYGANLNDSITKTLNNQKFLFPRNCKFYAKDVKDLNQYLQNEKYDLILLDPPWWNKYIRRKRKHSEHGYSMMYNEDLKNLPLENYLGDNGLVVVWCTNCSQHLNALKTDIFPKWGVKFWGKWYWVKVTKQGQPICAFSEPPRKQPFEQIIFGVKEGRRGNPPFDKLIISVPSALHSHKPPLSELLKDFLPQNPKSLEIFARYLLPNWTSYGNEVLRFQHESVFI